MVVELESFRKKGKLPNRKLFSVKYGLEYGSDELINLNSLFSHHMIQVICVIVDDVQVLNSGGTIDGGEGLCKLHGLEVKDKVCFMDIGIYNGYDIKSVVQYLHRPLK